MSCDVSLLSPLSYIENTVGCFNYSPSVGESKPLQRHTLIPPPFFFSLQGTHCLLNIISLSSMHTIGLKCGSFPTGGCGGGDGILLGGGIWVSELSLRIRLSLVTAFWLHLLCNPQCRVTLLFPSQPHRTDYGPLCTNNHYY